jgi:superfamily II DNA/RNA helicase
VLITNDLLALGIDMPALSVVLNYDHSAHPEAYIHRYVHTTLSE